MAALSEDAAAAAKRAALHDISNKGAMSGVSEKVTAALRNRPCPPGPRGAATRLFAGPRRHAPRAPRRHPLAALRPLAGPSLAVSRR